MSHGVVLVTCRQMQVELPRHRERIEARGLRVVAPELGGRQHFTSRELAALSDGLVGIVAGDDELDRAFFDAARELRVVVRWGIGMDSVDLPAALERGIRVRNTPGVFGEEVADSAFGYILNLARGHHVIDAAVREGKWPKVEGLTLAGARLGIVGLGVIGRAVSARARAFGMDVVAFDPFVEASRADATLVALDDLLETSRFVVLSCPLTDSTHHLIDAQRLARMRPDAYLVNVARGAVVDETALVSALEAGRLAGAGLDVFEVEPLPAESRLRELPNVLLGAHNASNTREGVARASAAAVDALIEELSA